MLTCSLLNLPYSTLEGVQTVNASSAFDWYCGNGSAINLLEHIIAHALFSPSPERHPAITKF